MAAANNGRYGTVDILLEKGAIPDMQDHVRSIAISRKSTNSYPSRVAGQH